MKVLVKQSKKKSSKLNYIIAFVLLIIIVIIASNPAKYSKVAFKGIEVWVKFLVPTLFPFFVLTRLFSSTGVINDFTKIFAKPFKKLYNCPPISSYIFLMSIITGYPVGAKLTSDCYDNGTLNKSEAIKTLSFCSNSGPMFILGSVAIGMFLNAKMGIIIYISHIFGSLLNGLIYRNIGKTEQNSKPTLNTSQNDINLSESISSSISSIMLIGGVICFTFVIIEIVTSSLIFKQIINTISFTGLNTNLINSIFSGVFEITQGCLLLSSLPYSFNTLTLLCTFIISFGGISTLLQATAFTRKIIHTKLFILQKLTHSAIASIICFVILLFI